MTTSLRIATLLSALLFLGYGSLVLISGAMRSEFERFGLPHLRRVTGALEVLGGLGLIVGLLSPAILVVSSGGLAFLMLLGVITRIRVRDRLLDSVPAAALMVLNGSILVVAVRLIGAS